MQSQVREDFLDHRLQNRRDDLWLAAAVWAVLQVQREHPLEQLGPTQPHRAVSLTIRLALGGRSGRSGRGGRRGRGTSAASRCMYSSGDILRCVVPSRQGVLSLSTT